MKTLRTTPVLWALTGLLAACGNTSTPLPTSGNQSPETSIKLSDGTALSTVSYLAPTEALVFGASDADGSVTKVHWVIDQGGTTERSGDFTGSDVKGKINFALPNLNSGSHTLNLTVTDNLGATGTASATFKVDAVAPIISTVTVNGTEVSDGQALNFASTDAATLKVSATDSRGGNDTSASTVGVLVYVGDTLVKTGVAPLTLDLAALIRPATNVSTIRIVAADSALNTSVSRSFTVQFAASAGTGTSDTAPVLSWLAPAGDYVRGGGAVVLRASAIKSGQDISSQVTYTTTCGSVSAGVWTLDSTCADGSKQTITANLTNGGKPYTISKTVTVDSSDPTVQLTSPQQGQTVTANPVNVTFAATDTGSGIDHVEVSATDASGNKQAVGSVASASGSVVWAPQNGTYTLTATAYDKVGRTSTATRSFTVATSSSITPGTPVLSAANTAGTNPQYVRGLGAVTGTASSTATITSAQLVVDGQTSGTATASTGSASFNFDFSLLNDGLHDIDLRWQDSAGTLTDSAKLSIFVDKTAPVLVWNTPVSGSVTNKPVVLGATATDAASGVKGAVAYTVAGQTVTSPWTPVADGAYEVTASASDALNNVGTQKTTVTYDATAPVITATSPTNAQVFTTAPVTISATATDNLSGVKSIEATIQGPNDSAPTTLGVQSGAAYSATYTPVDSGTYSVVYKAFDAAGNAASTMTRTFSYSVSKPAVETAPKPVLSVVGSSPFVGNMSVNASGNFDTSSQPDRMILQVTDSSGKVDNSSYVTPQSNATFSIDTTKFANGALQFQVIAYTKTGLVGKSLVTTAQVSNINNPQLSVAVPADGATVTSPTVPVRVTLTRQGTDYTFDPSTLVLKLIDYRGQVIETRSSTTATPVTCVSSVDLATYTCDTSFDMAGLPADTYTLQATASATVSGASPAVQNIATTSTFRSNTSSVNPPASTIRFPIAITRTDGSRAPAVIDSSSGFFATVSDNNAIAYVEARVVGPYAAGNIETDGTKQCQSSGTPLNTPIDVLLLNIPGTTLLPYQAQDVFVGNLDIDGSTFVPDNKVGQRYDLRVTVADNEGNRNIQCSAIVVQRGAVRPTYTVSQSAIPDGTTKRPTSSSGTWTISNVPTKSRVSGVVYARGVQIGSVFQADVSTGSVTVNQTFSDSGTYEVKWLVEDMTTGVVTKVDGGVINVGLNP